MALATTTPFPFFADLNGSPLDGGKVYFGSPNQNPMTSPVTVYWDNAGTQPVAQPAETLFGYIARSGTPSSVYANGDYSLMVRDKRGRLVFYAASSASFSNDTAFQALFDRLLATATTKDDGAGMIRFDDGLAYNQGTVGRALKGFVNAQAAPYNAVGDGVADDTAALDAAAAVAQASGRTLLLPGGTYRYNGFLQMRCNVLADGATIKQVRGSVSGANAAGLVTVAASGVTIKGLTLDCDLKSSGFTGDGLSNVRLEGCVVLNAVNLAGGFFNCANVKLLGCRAQNTRYYTAPSTGAPADPFYFGACTNSEWVGCVADDFRRLGFVAEGAGSNKSSGIRALFCVAKNANNCDDSTTEYNGGFWAENTNSVDWLYCEGQNLAGNAGQTSGRVLGMAAMQIGNNARGVARVIGCKLFGGSGYLPVGISIEGSGGAAPYADVIVEDCLVQKARSGVSTLCGINQLTISRLTLDDIVDTTGAGGGIVINGGAAARYLLDLLVEKVSATNSTFHANSGAVNWFSNPAGCNYTLRAFRGTHVMRNSIDAVRVEDSTVACGSTSYSTFLGTRVELIDSHMQSRNGASTDKIVDAASLPSGAVVIVRGGSIALPGGSWKPEFGGTSIKLIVEGTRHDGFTWWLTTVGTCLHKFTGATFDGISATDGAILTNPNSPTKQVFEAHGCTFTSTNAADTPIRKSTNNPTKSVLNGNTYNATNLHSLTASVQGTNYSVA